MRRVLVMAAAWSLAIASCAHEAPSTPETRRAARIASAHCRLPCPVGRPLASQDCCVDHEGLGWSACAWNVCGQDEACRRENDARSMAASCGEPEFAPCRAGGGP